jgi:hypothetical protein
MKILISVLLVIPQLLYSQEYSTNDILGAWEVSKCELFANGELMKTAYINNSLFDNKVVEGKYAGKLDEDITSIIKKVIGSVITLEDDSTVSWDGTYNDLNFSHEYWQLKPTGEILICKYENRLRLRPLLFVGRIIGLNNGGMVVTYFESGFEARLYFTKK